MDKKIQKVLDIWHKHFSNKKNHYIEFEDSDIEYFVGCMLYNHFKFLKALPTMKTMDLSYDFLEGCGDSYDEVYNIITSINIDDELKKVEFLQNFIQEAKKKYNDDELYLLNRLEYHIDSLAKRYEDDLEVKPVEFIPPKPKPKNPLESL